REVPTSARARLPERREAALAREELAALTVRLLLFARRGRELRARDDHGEHQVVSSVPLEAHTSARSERCLLLHELPNGFGKSTLAEGQVMRLQHGCSVTEQPPAGVKGQRGHATSAPLPATTYCAAPELASAELGETLRRPCVLGRLARARSHTGVDSVVPSAALAASTRTFPSSCLALPSTSICLLPITLPATSLILPPTCCAAPSPLLLSLLIGNFLQFCPRAATAVPAGFAVVRASSASPRGAFARTRDQSAARP